MANTIAELAGRDQKSEMLDVDPASPNPPRHAVAGLVERDGLDLCPFADEWVRQQPDTGAIAGRP
jgi:hypothetical protein